jgi:hypothetical protein
MFVYIMLTRTRTTVLYVKYSHNGQRVAVEAGGEE